MGSKWALSGDCKRGREQMAGTLSAENEFKREKDRLRIYKKTETPRRTTRRVESAACVQHPLKEKACDKEGRG